MPGKRVQFDQETWNALDLLAKDRMQDFQELADEAFADLLRKHGRPVDLKSALRQSVRETEKRPPREARGVEPNHRVAKRSVRELEHPYIAARATSFATVIAAHFRDIRRV